MDTHPGEPAARAPARGASDRKSTRLNSSHSQISYAVFCLTKKTTEGREQVYTSLALHQSSTPSLASSWHRIGSALSRSPSSFGRKPTRSSLSSTPVHNHPM